MRIIPNTFNSNTSFSVSSLLQRTFKVQFQSFRHDHATGEIILRPRLELNVFGIINIVPLVLGIMASNSAIAQFKLPGAGNVATDARAFSANPSAGLSTSRNGEVLDRMRETSGDPAQQDAALGFYLKSVIDACDDKANIPNYKRTEVTPDGSSGAKQFLVADNFVGGAWRCEIFEDPKRKAELKKFINEKTLKDTKTGEACFNGQLEQYAGYFQSFYGSIKNVGCQSLEQSLLDKETQREFACSLGSAAGSVLTLGITTGIGSLLGNSCYNVSNAANCLSQSVGMLVGRTKENITNMFSFFKSIYTEMIPGAVGGVGSAISNYMNGKSAGESSAGILTSLKNFAYSWIGYGAAEDKSAEAAHLVSQLTNTELEQAKGGIFNWIEKAAKWFYEFAFNLLPADMGCKKWSGLPYISTCEVPGVDWVCANPKDRTRMLCEMLGMLASDMMATPYSMGFLMQRAPKLAKMIAGKFSKGQMAAKAGLAQKVLATGVAKPTQLESFFGKTGGLLGRAASVAAKPLQLGMAFGNTQEAAIKFVFNKFGKIPVIGFVGRKLEAGFMKTQNLQGIFSTAGAGGGFKNFKEFELMQKSGALLEAQRAKELEADPTKKLKAEADYAAKQKEFTEKAVELIEASDKSVTKERAKEMAEFFADPKNLQQDVQFANLIHQNILFDKNGRKAFIEGQTSVMMALDGIKATSEIRAEVRDRFGEQLRQDLWNAELRRQSGEVAQDPKTAAKEMIQDIDGTATQVRDYIDSRVRVERALASVKLDVIKKNGLDKIASDVADLDVTRTSRSALANQLTPEGIKSRLEEKGYRVVSETANESSKGGRLETLVIEVNGGPDGVANRTSEYFSFTRKSDGSLEVMPQTGSEALISREIRAIKQGEAEVAAASVKSRIDDGRPLMGTPQAQKIMDKAAADQQRILDEIEGRLKHGPWEKNPAVVKQLLKEFEPRIKEVVRDAAESLKAAGARKDQVDIRNGGTSFVFKPTIESVADVIRAERLKNLDYQPHTSSVKVDATPTQVNRVLQALKARGFSDLTVHQIDPAHAEIFGPIEAKNLDMLGSAVIGQKVKYDDVKGGPQREGTVRAVIVDPARDIVARLTGRSGELGHVTPLKDIDAKLSKSPDDLALVLGTKSLSEKNPENLDMWKKVEENVLGCKQ